MGYTTDFEGSFNLDKPLTEAHKAYLQKFSETRRMKRDGNKASELPDPVREAANLPVGYQGCYFVGGSGFMGQGKDNSILDFNRAPDSQPGLWCQWIPNNDGTAIIWNGGEKFYEYVEWLEFIISHFLKPWGYTINGTVSWRGEDFSDVGDIIVKRNEITLKRWHDE